MRWLVGRDEEDARAFEKLVVRAASDHAHVKFDAPIAGAREIAFVPRMTGGQGMQPEELFSAQARCASSYLPVASLSCVLVSKSLAS
jgi:hypothetical protein